TLGTACQRFAQGGGVGVVGQVNGQMGTGFQVGAHGKVVPVQIVGKAHNAPVNGAGAAYADAGNLLPGGQFGAHFGNVIAHRFRRAGQTGGTAGFLQDHTLLVHQGGLDVGA